MRIQERSVSLDITRILAVLAVVMIHASGGFVVMYDRTDLEFLWGNLFDSAARVGVPLFVMISGALMLDEDRHVDGRKIFLAIKNIACLFLFWSVCYCCVYNIFLPLKRGQPVSASDIIHGLMLGYYHMWYLYMIVGLYLITPVLRTFVNREHKKLVLYLIVLSLIAQFTLPVLESFSSVFGELTYVMQVIQKFELDFVGGYTAYYLIGWYITHIGIRKKWPVYCLGILSLLEIILFVQITGEPYSGGYSLKSLFVLLYSVAVFVLLNQEIRWNIGGKAKKFVEVLSKLSFGVYIVHPLCESVVSKVFVYKGNPLLYILGYFLIVTTASFAGCFVVSRIPVMKKMIRM